MDWSDTYYGVPVNGGVAGINSAAKSDTLYTIETEMSFGGSDQEKIPLIVTILIRAYADV